MLHEAFASSHIRGRKEQHSYLPGVLKPYQNEKFQFLALGRLSVLSDWWIL